MAENIVRRHVLFEGDGGNFVRLQIEFCGDRIVIFTPQDKDAAGHEEAVKVVEALSTELFQIGIPHDAMACSLPMGHRVDRISFRKKHLK